jgi:hypothetical protein
VYHLAVSIDVSILDGKERGVPYPSRHNRARFPVRPLIPQNTPVIYASFFASWKTVSTFCPNSFPSNSCELYAVTVLNAFNFSSAVWRSASPRGRNSCARLGHVADRLLGNVAQFTEVSTVEDLLASGLAQNLGSQLTAKRETGGTTQSMTSVSLAEIQNIIDTTVSTSANGQ